MIKMLFFKKRIKSPENAKMSTMWLKEERRKGSSLTVLSCRGVVTTYFEWSTLLNQSDSS